MVTVDDLSLWIKENTKLKDSSISKYSRAVNTISREMKEKGVIPIGLFDMTPIQCDIYLPIILQHPDFIIKNTTGDRMYSNALKQYRIFRATVAEGVPDQTEIESVISNYSILDETERTAIVKSRVGQGIFRKKLLSKYNSTCVITGVSAPKLLIASHIKPWSVSDNTERLSEDNGILLTPTYDKLFDYGFITFTNQGKLIISSQISADDKRKLQLSADTVYDLKLTQKMREHLDYHRDIIFC